MPLTPSLERIGPICRQIEDAAQVLAVINGPDPTSIGSVDFGFAYDAGIDLRKIKVGYSPAWFGSVDFGSTRDATGRSEEHTSELQSLMRISYAVFCLTTHT